MVELAQKGPNPKINVMWLKIGTRVPWCQYAPEKSPIDWNIIFPFLGHFCTPGKSVRGLKKSLQCHLYGSYYIPIDSSRKTI